MRERPQNPRTDGGPPRRRHPRQLPQVHREAPARRRVDRRGKAQSVHGRQRGSAGEPGRHYVPDATFGVRLLSRRSSPGQHDAYHRRQTGHPGLRPDDRGDRRSKVRHDRGDSSPHQPGLHRNRPRFHQPRLHPQGDRHPPDRPRPHQGLRRRTRGRRSQVHQLSGSCRRSRPDHLRISLPHPPVFRPRHSSHLRIGGHCVGREPQLCHHRRGLPLHRPSSHDRRQSPPPRRSQVHGVRAGGRIRSRASHRPTSGPGEVHGRHGRGGRLGVQGGRRARVQGRRFRGGFRGESGGRYVRQGYRRGRR
mmetsp:Transcript_33500/g.99857  ORF Transcript_33500/g.99857 Transcript_33500/m.99857 type:complete len:306 (-) Transcript_33500:819-1736(-)